jgi:hypothetical protein
MGSSSARGRIIIAVLGPGLFCQSPRVTTCTLVDSGRILKDALRLRRDES